MITDILTITRKELKEIFVQRGSLRAGITNVLIVIAISGILFPLQSGPQWVQSPIGLVTVAWLPLMMSMGLVADAFAGERERHTLETLLASRLSDQAILYGKMLASIVYGFSIAVAGMLLGALVVNMQYPGAGFYPLPYFLGALIFCLLGMLLVAGIGVQVSLHASNVRQAYQKMSLGFILLWLPIILGPQLLPDEWMGQIALWLANINALQAALYFTGALLAADLFLIFLANKRFQRSRLILD